MSPLVWAQNPRVKKSFHGEGWWWWVLCVGKGQNMGRGFSQRGPRQKPGEKGDPINPSFADRCKHTRQLKSEGNLKWHGNKAVVSSTRAFAAGSCAVLVCSVLMDFPFQGSPGNLWRLSRGEASQGKTYMTNCRGYRRPLWELIGAVPEWDNCVGEPLLAWDNYFSGMFVLLGFYQWDNFSPK